MNETEILDMLDHRMQKETYCKGKRDVGNKLLQRENLLEIRKGRQEWEQKLASPDGAVALRIRLLLSTEANP